MKVTVFKNIWDVSEPMYTDVLAIFKRIKEGSSKELIEMIRAEKDTAKQNELKKRLPSILFSGRFSQRKSEFLLEHSGLICLDIDAVKDKDMDKVGQIIVDSTHTFGAFVSPRGSGFKVIVKIPPDRANHKGLFRALEKHFNEALGNYKIDQSGKDVSRVCYESYDPDMCYNPDSFIWSEVLEELVSEKNIEDYPKILELLQIWIDRKESYSKGNRNNYLCKFMYATCRYGVPDHITRNYLEEKHPGIPDGDLKTMLKSCYKAENFGTQHFTKKELEQKTTVVTVDESKQVTEFWQINDKGRVKIDTKQLLLYIEACGYGIYRQKEDVGSWDFVLIKNMIVDVVDVLDIKNDVLDYVEENAPGPVYDELQMRNRYFERTFLNALKVIEVDQIKDEKDKCYIFFDGFYYEITAKGATRCDYIDLEGLHIWRSQICSETITEVVDYEEHDFTKFVYNAMGTKDKFLSACTSLGYGIHTYKKQRLAKLIYCCDAGEGELDGLMAGGSGKNLYQKCLSLVRSVVDIDGKDFDKRDKFKFQQVRDDTQIINIDDYEGDIRELFTKITGGFSIEMKQIKRKTIAFEDSPKIFISSNAAPKGFSDSYARRLHILEFTNYYNHSHTPSDEFGDKDFFSDDWNQDDYNCLYSFLFLCVQGYLKNGIKEIEYKDLKAKQMVKNVGRDFSEYWSDKTAPILSEWVKGRELREQYCQEIQKDMTDQAFYAKMRMMCKLHGWKFENKGVGVNRKIKVTKNKE